MKDGSQLTGTLRLKPYCDALASVACRLSLSIFCDKAVNDTSVVEEGGYVCARRQQARLKLTRWTGRLTIPLSASSNLVQNVEKIAVSPVETHARHPLYTSLGRVIFMGLVNVLLYWN